MPVLPAFADWYASMSPEYLSGPKKIRHAAIRTRYGWPKLLRGKPEGASLRTLFGTDFREKVILSDAGDFGTYLPNDVLTPTMPQLVSTAIAARCQAKNSIAWTKNEEKTNGQSSAYSDEARSMLYFDLMTKLETQLQVNTVNGMEDLFMARPSTTTMEGSGATKPYSLFALVNEFPNSLYVYNTTDAFTTKHQITPGSAFQATFRNHVFGYDSTAVKPSSGSKNMLNALDTAKNRLSYDSPGTAGGARATQNWEDPGWNTKLGWLSNDGMDRLMDLARQRNDTWTTVSQMGIENPVYGAIELMAIPGLGSASVYPTDSYTANATPTTEGNSSAIGRGPRIYIVDTTGMHALFDRDTYFERTEPRTLDYQPFTKVVWLDCYFNYMVTAPWLCGVVAPGAVTGTFPSLTYTAAQVYAAY